MYMKRLHLFLAFAIVSCIMLSCGDDEEVKIASPEDNSETPVDSTYSQPYSQPVDSINEVIGSWYMSEKDAGWGGIHTFAPGEIVYRFYADGTLSVQEARDGKNVVFLREGTHEYSLDKENGEITIDGSRYGYRFNDKQLIIDTGSAYDWPLYKFHKQKEEPQVGDTPEEQDSVGGQPFGCAASFKLPGTIRLSDQNFAVIHSAEELAGIEIQNKKLPKVDFGENDLVLGVVRTPDTGFGIEKIDLKEGGDAYQLDVYIKEYDSGFCVLSWLLYWGVYPKLADKPVEVVLLNADGTTYKYMSYQEKYVAERDGIWTY